MSRITAPSPRLVVRSRRDQIAATARQATRKAVAEATSRMYEAQNAAALRRAMDEDPQFRRFIQAWMPGGNPDDR